MESYDEEIDHISNLFFIMQRQKFKIIELLKDEEIPFKDIQSQLKGEYDDDTHNYTLERNLEFLIKHDIIEKILTKNKDKDKKNYHLYRLTNLGAQLYTLSFSYQYLWKNKSYFFDHNALDLPKEFYLTIGIFANEKIQKIEGRPNIYSKLVDMYNDAEFVFNIVFELEGSKEISDILLNNFKSNPSFHTKTIVGSNKRLDPKRARKIIEFERFKDEGRLLQKEIAENIHISLVVTNKNAFISFPKERKGHPDTDIVLFGENGGFRIWCLDYFNYCWEQWPGKPFIDQIVD
jgi:DNA-binding HxlR family transcriptional regulator